MPIRKTLVERLRNYGTNHRLLYSFVFLVFFLSIYEGALVYIMPLVMIDSGLNYTVVGMIIASISIFGALFDIVLYRFTKQTTFRRLFLLMFAAMLLLPLLFWEAKHIWFFLLAMALFGMYYDLRNFGFMDVIGRCTPIDEHASSYGVLYIFKAAGSMITPLFIGGLVAEGVTRQSMTVPYLAFGMVVLFFVLLWSLSSQRRACRIFAIEPTPRNGKKPLVTWRNAWRISYPALIITLIISLMDGAFWSLGSVAAESLETLGPFRGLFLSAYFFPSLFIGWFVGVFSAQYGKLNTSAYAMLTSFAFISPIFLFQSQAIYIIILVFLSSCASSLVFPATDGWYADLISRAPVFERKMQGMADFISNIGYIIAPIIAGLFMDIWGPVGAFSGMGMIGTVISLFYLLFIPYSVRRNPPVNLPFKRL